MVQPRQWCSRDAEGERLMAHEPGSRTPAMEKRLKKKIEALNQRIQRLRQQLAGARKQRDESGEAAALERQLVEAEAELQKVKGAAG